MRLKSTLVCLLLLVLVLLVNATGTTTIDLIHRVVELDESENLLNDFLQLGSGNSVLSVNRLNGIMGQSSASRGSGGNNNNIQILVNLKHNSHFSSVLDRIGESNVQLVPPLSFIVHDDGYELAQKLREVSDGIAWIGHVKPEFKSMLNITEQNAITFDGVVEFYASVMTKTEKDTQLVVNHIQSVLASDIQILKRRVKDASPIAQISQASPTKLVVSVSPDMVESTLAYLKSIEEVYWIERRISFGFLNYGPNEIAQGFGAQSDELTGNINLWMRGLTGEGEVVGVVDSGIDYDNCFFRDQALSAPSADHRKIIGYELVTKTTEDKVVLNSTYGDELGRSHGTHVAGTVAGKALESVANATYLSKFDGAAKDAKIYMVDVQGAASGLLIPADITPIYTNAYTQGKARIINNSWGCDLGAVLYCVYDCTCTWVRDIPNIAKKGEQAQDSVCIANFGSKCCHACNFYTTNSYEVDDLMNKKDDLLLVFSAGNSGAIAQDSTIGTPSTAKNSLTVGASMNFNEYILASADYEDVSMYVSLLLNYGYQVHNTTECCSYSGVNADAVRSMCCLDTFRDNYKDKQTYNHMNMASFSSRGPASDGRLKPDLVAPGFKVISAHSDGDLNTMNSGVINPTESNPAALETLSGTSMAAPLASGSVALVRQYYRTVKNVENPSSALLKATAIHSTVDLTGGVSLDGASLWSILPPGPNKYFGHGLLSLSNVLRFNDSDFSMHFYDRVEMEDGDNNLYCYTAQQNTASIAATLTWIDPPASPSAAFALVNNLDLELLSYTDNSIISTKYPNGRQSSDKVNNVEKVVYKTTSGEKLVIRVYARTIVKNKQKYALVITGKNIAKSECDPVISASTSFAAGMTTLHLFIMTFALFVTMFVYV